MPEIGWAPRGRANDPPCAQSPGAVIVSGTRTSGGAPGSFSAECVWPCCPRGGPFASIAARIGRRERPHADSSDSVHDRRDRRLQDEVEVGGLVFSATVERGTCAACQLRPYLRATQRIRDTGSYVSQGRTRRELHSGLLSDTSIRRASSLGKLSSRRLSANSTNVRVRLPNGDDRATNIIGHTTIFLGCYQEEKKPGIQMDQLGGAEERTIGHDRFHGLLQQFSIFPSRISCSFVVSTIFG